MKQAKSLRNRNRKIALNLQESADAIVRKYGTPEPGRAELKGEKKPMRSHEEQRQQPTSYEGLRQIVAVKPQGYVGSPSSLSAQLDLSSRERQEDLLERMLEGNNLRHAFKRVKQNGGAPGIDGVTVAELQAHLWERWETVKAELQEGTYRPACQTGGNPQTRRRSSAVRHPNRNGSIHPASPYASNDTDL